jgi:hypothetical protein
MEKSAEDVLKEHIDVMGDELGRIYNSLTNEVTWVQDKWNQYQQLYIDSSERIELLNNVAGHFFGVIQDVLLKDVILHLATLTDPPQSVGKDNLTLQRLPNLLSDPILIEKVKTLVDAAIASCATSKTLRNRLIAHRSLELAIASATVPLPNISYADIRKALAAIIAVINCLESHYFDSQIDEHIITPFGDAGSLVKYIFQGLKAENELRERDLLEKYQD